MTAPSISLYQRQRKHRVELAWLRLVLAKALPLCQAEATEPGAPLLQLMEIEASIVSDRAIAKVHGDFLGDPTPTDVITFHHGEILVSADTAARVGPAHGLAFPQELALYLIHGLMHLGGWDDHEAGEAAEMKRRQERILHACL
jgi:probable rRNA maturation factor